MQLSEPAFLLGFMPAVVVGFYLVGLASRRGALGVLVAASLAFYAWNGIEGAVLLVVAAAGTCGLGKWMLGAKSDRQRKAIVWFGVVANVALLGYFKYAGFFVQSLNAATGSNWSVTAVLLPLGISFATFQRIAFLVDVHRGKVTEFGLLDFALFSTFFPCAACGPITRAREMLPQFREATGRFESTGFVEGVSLFIVGLAKKVVIADSLQVVSSQVFDRYALGAHADVLMTWVGVVAYSLQIYYDFSGYSEMALGVAKMVGLRLPINFNGPYRANSIIGFWNWWHMTLSRFLRDYLFATLASSSNLLKRYGGILVTMLIAGLWHGASWTFVVWGGAHGLMLVVNHAWRGIAERYPERLAFFTSKRAKPFGRLITFTAVTAAWVLFRSSDLQTAGSIYAGMVGTGATPLAVDRAWIRESIVPIVSVLALLWFTFRVPNAMAIFSKARPCVEPMPVIRTRWRWSANWQSAAVIGLVAFLVLRSFFAAHEVVRFSYANF